MKLLNKNNIIIFFGALLISRIGLFGIFPFSLAYFNALYIEQVQGRWIIIPIILGLISMVSPLMTFKYIFSILVTISISKSRLLMKYQLPKPVIIMMPSLFLGGYSFFVDYYHLDHFKIILLILEMLLVYVFTIIFQKSIRVLNNIGNQHIMDYEEIISLIIFMSLCFYGLPNVDIPNFALLETLVYFCIIFFTYKYGIGMGTMVSIILAAIMYFKGNAVIRVAPYPMIAIVSYLFLNFGKFVYSGIYIALVIIFNFAYGGKEFLINEVGAVISAVILFLFLPNKIAYRDIYRLNLRKDNNAFENQAKSLIQIKINEFAESFLKLSKTIHNNEDYLNYSIDRDRIFEELSDKMCRDCMNCSKCWEEKFEDTYEATSHLFKLAEEYGYIQEDEIPESFLKSCIHANKFITETNKGFQFAKLNKTWSYRLKENREIISGQFKEISEIMNGLSKELNQEEKILVLNNTLISKNLRIRGIVVKNIIGLENEYKRKEISIEAYCGKGCITTKEAALIISQSIGQKMIPSDNSKTVITTERGTFLFIEDTKFKVLTGIARGIKEKISGDNFSVQKLSNGNVMIALSDGVGTGHNAFKESDLVISLLEQFMEAGFNADAAIKLINSSLVLKNNEQSFTTLDMGVINLYTGICEFVKIGAATTFIKRGDWIETICSSSMPIGVINEMDFDFTTKTLYDGDIMIMVTDGVLDCIQDEDKEKSMKNIIRNINTRNAQEISNSILEQMLVITNYAPIDDMTILTAVIWSK